MVPWELWMRGGDIQVLERQYASAAAWADQVISRLSGGIWSEGFQLGDWLDPAAPADRPNEATTPNDLVATACAYRVMRQVADIAEVLERDADAVRYGEHARRVREAFRARFIGDAGAMSADTQTAYGLAIGYGLVENPAEVRMLGSRLADAVVRSGYRIATGFLGTPVVCDALTRAGYIDVAYRLVMQTEAPSWLHQISLGATTIWERWDSLLPDGSLNPGQMTSFNHYALGAVIDWFHRCIAGLSPLEPGHALTLVQPQPGTVRRAAARLTTGSGELSVRWALEGDTFKLELVVPPNAEALVILPDGTAPGRVGSGTHRYRAAMPDPAG